MEPTQSTAPPMQTLPLFPLDMVLFPGMHVSLHIFEERYKTMIMRCLDTNRPFGIVLPLAEQPQKFEPRKIRTHNIGCSARILGIEHLEGGEMDIEIEGVERFRILEQHDALPYRTGVVEAFADAAMSRARKNSADKLFGEVQTLLRDFLTRQLALLGQRVVEFDLPRDTAVLSFIAACVLPVDNADKQRLLETTDTAQRLDAERDVLRRAIAQLRRGEARVRQEGDGGPASASARARFEPIRAERYHDYLCGN